MSAFTQARILSLAVPAALMAGALGSQLFGGLVPCEMCQWQRWPHYSAIVIAILAFIAPTGMRRPLVWLAALAILTSAGLAVWHAGVEYHWWVGPTHCTRTLGGSGGDFMADLMKAPLIQCDQPQWTLFGISLAGFNAMISGAGALVIVMLLRKRT